MHSCERLLVEATRKEQVLCLGILQVTMWSSKQKTTCCIRICALKSSTAEAHGDIANKAPQLSTISSEAKKGNQGQ